MRVAKIRVAQVCFCKIRTFQISFAKICSSEVSVLQSRVPQVRISKIGLAEIRRRQICILQEKASGLANRSLLKAAEADLRGANFAITAKLSRREPRVAGPKKDTQGP